MSRTPEIIVNKPLKVLQQALAGAGAIFLLAGGIHCALGNNGILQLIGAGALFWLASKIKHTWKKGGEVGVYH